MNVFGTRSKQVRETLHEDLVKIMDLTIQRSPVDFGLHEGARSIDTQQKYFDSGASKINPSAYRDKRELARKAKHIVINGEPEFEKSRAVDFHVSEKYGTQRLTWNEVHMSLVIGVAISCAKELHAKGEISHLLRSGADWDGDGVLKFDQSLNDFPHMELVKP